MAICLVCGKFEEAELKAALTKGWVFAKCPECQRGIPLDILAMHLSRSTHERYFEGFCDRHWFKDSGICGYCKMRRQGVSDIVT
ncbi:MAG: hypothetical protein EPO62_02420 [Candidatus Nitrosotenuis sp.]|nr:MAG: hypothetical protein EPO62_02420 [Candidatus Nitrosotenuis sp.]